MIELYLHCRICMSGELEILINAERDTILVRCPKHGDVTKIGIDDEAKRKFKGIVCEECKAGTPHVHDGE